MLIHDRDMFRVEVLEKESFETYLASRRADNQCTVLEETLLTNYEDSLSGTAYSFLTKVPARLKREQDGTQGHFDGLRIKLVRCSSVFIITEVACS